MMDTDTNIEPTCEYIEDDEVCDADGTLYRVNAPVAIPGGGEVVCPRHLPCVLVPQPDARSARWTVTLVTDAA